MTQMLRTVCGNNVCTTDKPHYYSGPEKWFWGRKVWGVTQGVQELSLLSLCLIIAYIFEIINKE